MMESACIKVAIQYLEHELHLQSTKKVTQKPYDCAFICILVCMYIYLHLNFQWEKRVQDLYKMDFKSKFC